MEKRVTTPLTLEQVKDLKSGDSVLISGVIYTARDAAHKIHKAVGFREVGIENGLIQLEITYEEYLSDTSKK